jgi:hypothetical protein
VSSGGAPDDWPVIGEEASWSASGIVSPGELLKPFPRSGEEIARGLDGEVPRDGMCVDRTRSTCGLATVWRYCPER